jgi:speckle-type POZ protein
VIKPPRTKLRKDLVVVPLVELPGHLVGALRNGMGVDVMFHVGGRAFDAHMILLAARSAVFEAMLFGEMMEKDTRSIEVERWAKDRLL